MREVVRDLKRRVGNMLVRCVLTLTKDDAGVQVHQIRLLSDETKDGVERFQNYGFTSHPLPGAEGLTIFLGGGRDHAVTIVMDDRRYRFKATEAGEVCVYTDEDQLAGGHRIHFRRGQLIEVACKNLKIEASESIEITAGQRVDIDGGTNVAVTSPRVDWN